MADRILTADSEVSQLVFSTDGTTIAGLCNDGAIRAWDARSGAPRKPLALMDKKTTGGVMLLPGGEQALILQDQKVKLWDLARETALSATGATDPRGTAKSISADRKQLAISSTKDRTVSLYEANAATPKYTFPDGIGGAAVLTFSPGGDVLVGANYDTDMRIWSTKSGELLRKVEDIPVTMFAVEFSPDGKTLATAGVDKTIYLWDTATWKLKKKLTGHTQMISRLAFSADGRHIVTGGFDELTQKNPVKVILWDVATGGVLRTVDAPHRVSSLAFSPSGAEVAVAAAAKQIHIWQVPVRH